MIFSKLLKLIESQTMSETNSQRAKSQIGLILGILVCVGLLFFFAWVFAEKVVPNTIQPNPPETKIFALGLANEGWSFTPVDPVHPQSSGIFQAFLSRDRAINAANNYEPYLQKSPDLTGIVAYLGMFSDAGLKASAQAGEKVDPTFLNPRLVWIVSYQGIQEQSSGPPESEHRFSNELNVVVDAFSGKILLEFVWTR